MERVVEPEWLDTLPAEDRRAKGSRRDLRRLNYLMGHAVTMSRLVARTSLPVGIWHLAELGAGDGAFALQLVRRIPPGRRPASVTLVDRIALVNTRTENGFAKVGCKVTNVCGDVFEWLASAPQTTVLSANLFLHHFPDDDLARLLQLAAARCTTLIACEPRRSWLSLTASNLLGLIGCNGVTRHDAAISVRAGFADRELSRLWMKDSRWTLEEQPAGLFSHAFAARITSGKPATKREL